MISELTKHSSKNWLLLQDRWVQCFCMHSLHATICCKALQMNSLGIFGTPVVLFWLFTIMFNANHATLQKYFKWALFVTHIDHLPYITRKTRMLKTLAAKSPFQVEVIFCYTQGCNQSSQFSFQLILLLIPYYSKALFHFLATVLPWGKEVGLWNHCVVCMHVPVFQLLNQLADIHCIMCYFPVFHSQ